MVPFHDVYFNGDTDISDRLANALGLPVRNGTAQRFRIAYALAEGLGINSASLGSEAMSVLLGLLPILEEASLAPTAEAASRCVRDAGGVFEAKEVALDRSLNILVEFDWWDFSPPIRANGVKELCEQVLWNIEQAMTTRVLRMLAQWQVRGWNDDTPEQAPPRRLVTSSNRKRMSEGNKRPSS